jgi:hypothetical protein
VGPIARRPWTTSLDFTVEDTLDAGFDGKDQLLRLRNQDTIAWWASNIGIRVKQIENLY